MITVMVIEDDPAISMGIKEMLLTENYEVITIADGIKGLSKTLSIQPSIVILDINLPGLNGFDICKKLRESNFNNPIIMLTARSEEIDKVLGLEIGADDYLTKPFGSRELLARVRVQLRNARRIEDFNRPHGNMGQNRKKLLTIMFTDMKDYSKIMNQNEDRAILTLKKHNEILNSYINDFYGRVVETFGDGYLVSFESAINAANCSYSIQKALKEYNKNKSSDEKIELRIGIHLGDVIKFEDKLKGDTLNIAARIQQNTSPGEINISQNVYDSIKNKVKFKIVQKGAQKFKNIEEPVLIFSIPI